MKFDCYLLASFWKRCTAYIPNRLLSVAVFVVIVFVGGLGTSSVSSRNKQTLADTVVSPASQIPVDSVYMATPSPTHQKPLTTAEKRLRERKLKKAKLAVEHRRKQLDRARDNYLRIRGQLTQAGLSDRYAELARERIDEASVALAEAKAELEHTQHAFGLAQETALK